ncbi:MAG TPA: hypothetical protein PLV83_03935 [Bacilli bacterium]|nr:hypothetical protein [Bacilli bacterium]
MYRTSYPINYYNKNDERLGFLGPFLLGGIAGGLVSPFFYNGGYYPNQGYNNNYYYPYPYNPYYYGPYYK